MVYPLYGYSDRSLGGWTERNSCHTRRILQKIKFFPALLVSWWASGRRKEGKYVIIGVQPGFRLVRSPGGSDKKSLEL